MPMDAPLDLDVIINDSSRVERTSVLKWENLNPTAILCRLCLSLRSDIGYKFVR